MEPLRYWTCFLRCVNEFLSIYMTRFLFLSPKTALAKQRKMVIQFRHQIFKNGDAKASEASFNLKSKWKFFLVYSMQVESHLDRTPRVLCRETICHQLRVTLCWRHEWHRTTPWAWRRENRVSLLLVCDGGFNWAENSRRKHLLNDDNRHNDNDPGNHISSDVL
jgi:hypothetical protein